MTERQITKICLTIKSSYAKRVHTYTYYKTELPAVSVSYIFGWIF